ncbi:hypothetical protein C6341_g20040 [Phytophthora cactorum]|nr:hypothetical protein C6341_g20040 [Phytophthora cactorum]
MVYSKSEEEFQQHADKFKVVACRDERNALWTYFETNWIACKEMWVALYRMDLPHFRNNTNNRLDNFLGKLKADLGSSMSMRLCLNAVIRYQRRREDEYVARVIMPGSKRNHRYNDDSNQLLGNDWLADIYSSEYKFAAAQGAMDSYVVEDEELFVTLRRDGRAHKVDKFNWLCSCEFSSTMQLPYRHSMMYRKNVCGLFMIPYASIPARWLRYGNLDENLVDVDVPIRISKADPAVKRLKPMSSLEKFKSAQALFNRISDELSDLPTSKFQAGIINLEKWCQNLRQGDVAMPGEVTMPASESPSGESDIEPPTQESKKDSTKDDNTEESKGPAVADVGEEDQTATKPEISPFNPRAKRVERPKKDKKAENQMRNQDRKEYNRGSKLRNAVRGDDVVRVEEFLKTAMPPLVELSSFITTFAIRYRGHRAKQMTVEKQLPDSSCKPFRLSESVVRTALETIEKAIPLNEAMDLTNSQSASEECWVITIDGVGNFTHNQIMAMQFIWSLAKICTDAMSCYSWLMISVDAQFKDDGAAEIAEKVLSSWPCARLEGFDSDFTLKWAHVYCVRADCWFNDILVAAFAKVLANKYLNNTTIFLSELMTPAPNRGNRLPPPTLSQVAGATEAFVFMHLNINSSHWACIVLGTARRTIYCYDSMDKRAHHNLLEALAQELVKRSLPHAYQISSVHSPLQSDEYNCGLFVCLFFWRRLAKEVGSDYTERGLMRRRWDILRMVVQATMDKGSKEKSG